MFQIIDVNTSSFLSQKSSILRHGWSYVVQRVIKAIVRMIEYHAYCADDPCLHRRYYICSVTGRPAKKFQDNDFEPIIQEG